MGGAGDGFEQPLFSNFSSENFKYGLLGVCIGVGISYMIGLYDSKQSVLSNNFSSINNQTMMETIYGIDDYLLSSQEQTSTPSSQQKETSLLEMRLGE